MSDEKKEAAHDEHHESHDGFYITIGGVLLVGTVLTVAVSWIHFESFLLTLVVALAIASVKAGLVATFFMHLKDDIKKHALAYSLALTALFFAVLMIVPITTDSGSVGENIAPPARIVVDHHGEDHGEHGEDHGDDHGHDHEHGDDHSH